MLDFSEIESLPVENIRSNIEHLTKHTYSFDKFYCTKKPDHIKINSKKTKFQKIDAFELRLVPEPNEKLSGIINNYVGKNLIGRYKTRRSPPFLILSPEEIALMIHLPDPNTKNLTLTRKQSLPQQQINKTGFCLGYESFRKTQSYDSGSIMGNFVHAAETKSIVIATTDIPTHFYAVGGTGSGKTTLIRVFAKHLEMSNLNGTYPNAFIYIDPKGSDSYQFIRQCEDESFAQNRVHYLDPKETKFSINILELPPYKPEDRDNIVSMYVGQIMKMIKIWYNGADSFVRLERILDTMLHYIYLNEDKPTFIDLHKLIIDIQAEKEDILPKIFKELGKPPEALKQAMESISAMSKEAFEPVLNRVEKFATDKILSHLFCVRESTVNLEEWITPGHITIIRLTPLSLPENLITLAKQTIVIKLWFMIQARAEKIKIESKRSQVVLVLDEFQDISGLPVIEQILTQARSFRLSLFLAHQTSKQLDDRLFEIILGNTDTQFVGKVSGMDARRFAVSWDPDFSTKLHSLLATQEKRHWAARLNPELEESQALPTQFWPFWVKDDLQTEEFMNEFIKSEKERYGYGVIGPSIFEMNSSSNNEWLRYCSNGTTKT